MACTAHACSARLQHMPTTAHARHRHRAGSGVTHLLTDEVAPRFQGSNHALRLAQSSRMDGVLWAALVARYPDHVDDYAFPMLRVDLSADELGAERQVYLPPLLDSKGAYLIGNTDMGGVAEGGAAGLSAAGREALLPPHRKAELHALAEDAVATALEEQVMTVSEGEMRTLIESLLEYAGPHAKWQIRQTLGGGERVRHAQAPVGISLTLNQDFDAWVGGASEAASSRVHSDRGGEYAEKVRKALAGLLKIPVGCVEMAGLHRGSIIVDLNLSAPPGDARTPMQLFEQLVALIAAPDSPLKQDPTLCNAVRAILRGAPHHVPTARRAGGASVGDAAGAAHGAGSKDAGAANGAGAGALSASAAAPAANTVPSESFPQAAAAPAAAVPAARGTTPGPRTAPRPASASAAKVTNLARAAVLAEAADRLQAGWVNKRYFYSSGKQRLGPVSVCS